MAAENHEGLVVLSTESAKYFADLITQRLSENGYSIHFLQVHRRAFQDGERYYRLDVQGNFDLLGKTAVYVCPLLGDSDILEVYRVGSTLSQLGVRRRIFIIPFLAYSTMERAVQPGEVVTGKLTIQMLSSIGSAGNGNVFILLDLHTSGLLHYFEGSCTRLELYGQRVLERSLSMLGFCSDTHMFASGDLGRSAWVNAFARDNGTGVAFIRKQRVTIDGKSTTEVCEVIGSVAGKHVIIYDDMTRSGGTLVHAAETYLREGALSVDVLVTHLRLIGSAEVNYLAASPIRRIVSTNSCPMTQWPEIQQNPKFIILDASPEFVHYLLEIIPKTLAVGPRA